MEPKTAALQDPNSPASDRTRESRFARIKQEIHRNLISSIDTSCLNSMDDYHLRSELRRGISRLSRARSELLSEAERTRLTEEIIDETLGLGPLEPLLRDPSVSDILVNGPSTVYVERRGQLEPTTVTFHDLDHLIEIVQRIASKVGRRLDAASPMVDARLEDGTRVNAVIGPLALDGALVSIRRFGHSRLEAADLIAQQTLPPQMWQFLAACVQAGLNLVISGGTGSGKSTLLNALCSAIPSQQRIVTIEDAAELKLGQPHVARMETRQSNVEGQGQVTARDLLKNALRMRPDRIIIGECRGAEAFDMLQAMTTGHDGSLTTIHADSPRNALRRLQLLVGLAGADLPSWFIRELVGSAVQIVVQCLRLPDGSRKVTAISEVTGMRGERVGMQDIFEYRFQQGGSNATSSGHFHATGNRPQSLDHLLSRGCSLDPSIFAKRLLPIEPSDESMRRASVSREV